MEALRKAERDLQDFLMQNRHLVPFQVKLNTAMNKVPDHMRILVLSVFIRDNLDELSTELQLLQGVINDYTSKHTK
jgi:hypothetical protein